MQQSLQTIQIPATFCNGIILYYYFIKEKNMLQVAAGTKTNERGEKEGEKILRQF